MGKRALMNGERGGGPGNRIERKYIRRIGQPDRRLLLDEPPRCFFDAKFPRRRGDSRAFAEIERSARIARRGCLIMRER